MNIAPATRLLCAVSGSDSPCEHVNELIDSRILAFTDFPLTPEKTGIQFLRQEGILKAFHGPVEYRDDHLEIEMLTNFPALYSEFDEGDCAVRIFRQEKAIDFPF